MKKLFVKTTVLPMFLLLVLLLTGCGTEAHRIEPSSKDALVTISGVDPQDWNYAAERNINSLLESGVLMRNGKPGLVMISRVRNYTMIHLDTQVLTAKIRQAILRSGQARVTSALGVGSNLDLSVRRIRDKELDDLFDQSTVMKRGTVLAPNLSLSGAIVQQTTYQGRKEESYFQFHLVLTDLVTGIAVWENCVDILKQGTHPLFF